MRLHTSKGLYVIVIKVGGQDSHVLWLAYYILWAEPRMRAFGNARAIIRKRAQKQPGYLKRALIARIKSSIFTGMTSIPFAYVKHINLIVMMLSDGVPLTRQEREDMLMDYTLYDFN